MKKKLYINLSGVALKDLHPILKNFYKRLEKHYQINYINSKKTNIQTKNIPKIQIKKGISKIVFNLKKIINNIIPRLNIIRTNYDGPILTANNFLITSNEYYIVTSSLIQFGGLQLQPLYNPLFKLLFKFLFLHSNLKKIFFYSQTAKKEFLEYCTRILKIESQKVESKIDIIYPFLKDTATISESQIISKIDKKDLLSFLFIGRNFIRKGGIELIEALKLLEEKQKDILFKIEINIISNIPLKYYNIISEFKNRGVNINTYAPKFSQQELEDKFYKTNTVLLHLTRGDVFGMVSLESKKNGLAVITTKQYLNYPELFKEGEALFVDIDKNFIWNNGLPVREYKTILNTPYPILDYNQITYHIINLVQNKELLKQIAIANFRSLKRFENNKDRKNLFK